MTPNNMRNAPHLPLLSMDQCVAVFKEVGVPKAVLARLSGFARMQVFRWFTGRSVRPLRVTLEYVSELAWKMIRAEQAGRIPKAQSSNMRQWADAVADSNYPTPISQATLETLLSPRWATTLNLTPEAEDAVA